MPIHRRFTAKNALFVLLVWLFLALAYHLKEELWSSTPSLVELGQEHLTGAEPQKTPVEPEKLANGKGTDAGKGEKDNSKDETKDGGKKSNAKRTAVVVATQKSEDPKWLDEYFPSWEKFIYSVDDRNAKLTVPKNKGRESMAYLT